MGLLTYLVDAKIGAAQTELEGKVLSRPVLLVTDGQSATWCCDVDVGQKTYQTDTGEEVAAPLRNVPIAAGTREISYADVGAAVTVRRSASGRFEVVGFSKRAPGTYTRVPVTIPAPTIGPVPYVLGAAVSAGLSARPLTYGELATLAGGYGTAPYGATGVWRGDTLLEVRT